MRITKEKFENICYWVHVDKNKCEKLRDEQLLRRPYINLNKRKVENIKHTIFEVEFPPKIVLELEKLEKSLDSNFIDTD